MMIKCNCHSYNRDDANSGKDQEIALYPPKSLGIDRDTVCVDACISHVIKHLWDNQISTLNSCCGHGKDNPSIILQSYISDDDANKIRELISQVDSRFFKLMAWKLIEV